ncbi:MAG: exodeoxyribonuclease VII small subunit [Bacteroidota bacterium]
MMEEKLTYEAALSELENIVAQLQQQAVGIDDLEQKSKRASELLAFCQGKLRQVKQQLDDTFELNS